MHDPAEWRRRGVHWHAYSSADTAPGYPRNRTDRLDLPPEAILRTPEEVADWIASRTREQIDCRPVRFLPLEKGMRGTLGDERHLELDRHSDLRAAGRGDSLYTDIPRQSDRLHLWAEAVTSDECEGAHD